MVVIKLVTRDDYTAVSDILDLKLCNNR